MDDQFENVLYRTEQTDCTTKIVFVSQAFYSSFAEKMESDFSNSISIDKNVLSVQKCLRIHVEWNVPSRWTSFSKLLRWLVSAQDMERGQIPTIAKSLSSAYVTHADELSQMKQGEAQQQDLRTITT